MPFHLKACRAAHGHHTTKIAPRPALPLSAPYAPAVKLDQLLEDRKP